MDKRLNELLRNTLPGTRFLSSFSFMMMDEGMIKERNSLYHMQFRM